MMAEAKKMTRAKSARKKRTRKVRMEGSLERIESDTLLHHDDTVIVLYRMTLVIVTVVAKDLGEARPPNDMTDVRSRIINPSALDEEVDHPRRGNAIEVRSICFRCWSANFIGFIAVPCVRYHIIISIRT